MKLVVSIMPRSLEEAQQLDSSRYEDADVIEWRADFLEKSEILTVAPAVFEKFAGREILFTLRTRAEGGEMELTNEEYVGILKDIQSIYHPDYIDFEYYSHREVLEILSELTSFSPKLVKVSVMAHNEQDVLDLMNYTRGFKTLNPEQEYVTISMGKVGKISRLTADLTGSSWSYARVGDESAPGQIPLENMRRIRELLNED